MKVQDKVVSERDARALTEEIDQATDAAVAQEASAGVREQERAQDRERLRSDMNRSEWARSQGGRIVGTMDDEVLTGKSNILNNDRGQEWGYDAASEAMGGESWSAGAETADSFVELADDTAELVTDEAELVDADAFVGDETKRQVNSRLEDDREDFLTGIGKGSPRDFRIMTRSLKRLTDEAIMIVQRLIKKEATHPAKLEHLRFSLMTALLRDAYNRVFGDRN